MRIPVATIFCALSTGVIAQTPDSIQSEVFTADGSQSEITSRAALCMSRMLTFDVSTLSNEQAGRVMRAQKKSSPLNPFALPDAPSGRIEVVTTDTSLGTVVAQNRLPFKWYALAIAQSTLTLEAKDGRFRFIHSGIQLDGLPINPKHANAKIALEELSKESSAIAECVQKPSESW